MRIFLAFPRRGNNDIQNSEIWLKHVIPSLEKLGHELVVLDRDFGSLNSDLFASLDEERRERENFTENLYDSVVKAHNEKPIDLFFSYFYSRCVDTEVVSAIKDLGIPTLNFSCNNVHQFFTVEEISPLYDYCMVPERAALGKFREVGATALHVQMGANPEFFVRSNLERQYSMIFIGSKYADRPAYIAELIRHGVDIRVWGAGWQIDNVRKMASRGIFAMQAGGVPRLWRGIKKLASGWSDSKVVERIAGPVLTDEEMISTYNASAMALNFSKALLEGSESEYVRHMRMRDFEIPMTGVAAFLEYSDELGEYYDLDTEVVTFDDPEELASKASYYSRHNEELRKVGEAGYRRAIGEHTWEARFRKVFELIGLPA